MGVSPIGGEDWNLPFSYILGIFIMKKQMLKGLFYVLAKDAPTWEAHTFPFEDLISEYSLQDSYTYETGNFGIHAFNPNTSPQSFLEFLPILIKAIITSFD